MVLFGACMVIGDGVLTPAISGKNVKGTMESPILCFYVLSFVAKTKYCFSL